MKKIVNSSTQDLYTPTTFQGYSRYVSPDSEKIIKNNSATDQMPFSKSELNILDLEVSSTFDKENKNGKPFYKMVWNNDHAILVTFIPIKNVAGDQVAFVIYHQHFTSAE